MRKSLGRCLCACLLLAVLGQSAPVFAITDEDRIFFERLVKRKGSDEEVLLLSVVVNEAEGNYAVLQKFKELQAIVESHKKCDIPESAHIWIYGKTAYYESVHGSKAKAASACNVVMSIIKKMPEPSDLDGGFFYVDGAEAAAKAMWILNRREDYNRTETMLGHGRMRFGRKSTQDKMFEALIYTIEDDFDSARALCSDVIKAEPGYAGSYFWRGLLDYFQDKNAAAIRDLERSLLMCPDFSRASMLKACCYLELDKKDEALAEINKTLEMEHSSTAYQIRAAIKLNSDDEEGGAADLKAAMNAPDANWNAFSMQGDYMMHYKDFDQAIKSYTRSLEMIDEGRTLHEGRLKKAKARIYYRRGLCYRANRNGEKAIADLQQACIFDSSRTTQVRKLLAKVDDDTDKDEKDSDGKIASGKTDSDKGDKGDKGDKSGNDKGESGKVVSDKSGNDKIASATVTSSKATLDSAGSDKAGSDKAGSDKTGSDKAGSDKAGSDKAGSDKTGSDKAGSDKAGSDKTGSDKIASDKGASGKANSEKGSSEKTGTNKALDSELAAADQEFKDYVSAFEPTMPTYREGLNRSEVKAAKSSDKKDHGKKQDRKTSFIIEADDPKSKDNSSRGGKAKPTSEDAKANANKGSRSASSESSNVAKDQPAAAPTSDPYLRYLEQHMSSAVENAPSANVSATVQISNDGVPIVQVIDATGINYNRFTNLIIRAAPFKTPPPDKKNLFRVEMQANSSVVRVRFAE